MIRYFPTPYPDELLYSLIARFGNIMFPDNPIGLARCLFGNSSLRASIDLNSHLKVFLERTNSFLPYSESQLINAHTLYPYYSCFLNEDEKRKVLNSMLSGSGQGIHTRVGINASGLKRPRFPKYCAQCYLEDLARISEAFWHRSHQLPGVNVCGIHNVILEIYEPKVNQLGTGYYLAPPDRLKLDTIRNNQCDTSLYIAKTSLDILLNQSFDINTINYRDHLISLGYYRNSKIDQASILSRFTSFYEKGTLNNLIPQIGSDLGWISEIIRRPQHVFNPIRHIIFSKFCFELPLKHFPISSPFGRGPWTCYNKTSDHYLQNVVQQSDVHVDRKSKRQIGVFTCKCGMIYTMSYVQNNDGLKKYIRIKEFGETWGTRLKQEIESEKSLREIARILGTDAKTIKIKSETLFKTKTTVSTVADNLGDQKYQWTSAFKKDSSKTIKEARETMPSIYMALYRHANEWLLAFNASRRRTQKNQGTLRLDWHECDEAILAKLQDAVSYLNKSGFKGRLTKSLIAKVAGHQSQLMKSNINKLPKSSNYLLQKSESKDDFQKRRIRIAIHELKQIKMPLKRWRVIKQSQLRSPIKTSLIQYTDKLLK